MASYQSNDLDERIVRKLGVLFVHGIGEQKEGETLTSFAEPLIAWLRKAIAGHGQRAVTEPYSDGEVSALEVLKTPADGISVKYASLLPSRRLSAGPAHALVELRVSHKGSGQQCQQWLFAESWWGEQVQPPDVFDLIQWLFSRGPWIALIHLAERARRFTSERAGKENIFKASWRIARTIVAAVVAALIFVFLAAILQLTLSVAWVLALIPVPVFRRYLSLVLQKLTLIIGDSYGLVANDTQRAAILSRFRTTVDWLQAHCEKVVIIAHSQGSAVVSEAIKDGIIPHPPLLLTFGSGSTKLSQLRLCELAHSARLTAAAWIVPSLMAGTLLWAFFGQTVNGLFFSIFGLYAVSVGCAVAAWAVWSKTRQYPHPPGLLKGDEQHRWIDLYATNDPVPQGALSEHFLNCGIISERIVNRRSTLTDHTTYWSNKTEFVSRVATELCEEAGLKGMPVLSSEHYRWARGHHRVTIAALVTAFWTIAASIFLVALLRFKDLSDLGRQMFAAVQSGPFTSIVTYLQAAAKASRWILLETSGAVPPWHDNAAYASLAILVLLLIAYLWWHIVVALLVKWDGALLDDFLTQSNNWGKYGAWFVWPFIFLFLLMPLALSYAPSLGGGALLLIRAMAILLALLFLFAIVASVYTSMPKNRLQFKATYSSVLMALKEATLPGSDDPSSERRGWNSWKNLFECCVFVMMVGGSFGVAAEKLFGVQDAISWLMVAMYGTAGVLMLVRLGRLALRRTGTKFLAFGIAVMPVVIGMFSTWGFRTGSSTWISIGVLTAAAIPLTYFVVDRCRRGEINLTRQDL